MLGKILLLGLVLWLVLTILKQYRRSIDQQPPKKPETEDMVRCAECGVHLPRSESIEDDGRYYCSEDHRNRPAR